MDVLPLSNGHQEIITRQAAMSSLFHHADIAFGGDNTPSKKLQNVLEESRYKEDQDRDIMHTFTTNVKGKQVRRRLNYQKRFTIFSSSKTWRKAWGPFSVSFTVSASLKATFKISIHHSKIKTIHMKLEGNVNVGATV